MEKVSFGQLLSFWLALGLLGLAWIGQSFGDFQLGQMSHFVKIDCEYYQIFALRILGSRSVWGMKDSWKGPYDIKAMVVISLSHLI